MGDHSDPTQPLMPHLHLRILNSASLIVLGKSEKVMQLCRYFCLCLNQLSILISIYICLPPKIPTHPRDFKGRPFKNYVAKFLKCLGKYFRMFSRILHLIIKALKQSLFHSLWEHFFSVNMCGPHQDDQ